MKSDLMVFSFFFIHYRNTNSVSVMASHFCTNDRDSHRQGFIPKNSMQPMLSACIVGLPISLDATLKQRALAGIPSVCVSVSDCLRVA